jgi:hypothetical protein
MGGKAALIVVFGLTFLFSAYQLRTGSVTTRAADNLYTYYETKTAHQISVSGLNIAAAKLYEDNTWRGPMTHMPFRGGEFNLDFVNFGDTLVVACEGRYEGVIDTVMAFFSLNNPYTKYTFFTFQENGVNWAPNDTVWGPIHTNATLNHQNDASIVFFGKVTAGKGISAPPKNAKTQFLGGYEVGVYVPQVTNMTDLVSAATAGGFLSANAADTLKIEFNNDGTLDVFINSGLVHDDITFGALAPNSAIYAAGPVVVGGPGPVDTPTGGISIGSGSTMQLENPFKYADDPLTNPSSDDLLALISMDNINFNNQTIADWDMQCVLMTINGSLTATDMVKNGSFDYLGSVYQNVRGNAKMFQSFMKKYHHDIRLNHMTPPFYPGANDLQLIAWWE